MSSSISFDFPLGWQVGLPLAAAVLGLWFLVLRRRGVGSIRCAWLTALRGVALGVLVFLAARPVWTASEEPTAENRPVLVLLDRSESMSLGEGDGTRFDSARGFANQHLLPALRRSELPVSAVLFAEGTESADAALLASATPDGKRTDLAGAIADSTSAGAVPPLAVVALTDGIFNEPAENSRALSRLLEERVPFIGVGFGNDTPARTLVLRQVEAPPTVAPKTGFQVSALLEMTGDEAIPQFDLVLFRDGKFAEKKTIEAGEGSRTWMESFHLNEPETGAHEYTVQMMAPDDPGLKTVNDAGSAFVRIDNAREVRVLYVQGALTWDYKFATLALRNDPTIQLTGLTRTSKQSFFRQNVESAGELTQGFPSTMEELALYRVVVLSNMKPADLSGSQQDALARYCKELGGGILMIGGPDTFDASWRNTRLEEILPVVFSPVRGVSGLDQPFRLKVTDEALRNPVFRIADNRPLREVWGELPTFTRYGRVQSAKPGAQVWAEHSKDVGPHGRRILMAVQRYGAGQAAVIAVQNFWRWRLARDADTQQFDRFWRQLFRFLGDSGRQDVAIFLADQRLHPHMDVHLTLERQPDPKNVTALAAPLWVRVADENEKILLEETLTLQPGQPVDLSFRAEEAGIYLVTVEDSPGGVAIATRSVEIRDVNVELQNTARNMESLRQWSALTDGIALKAEECDEPSELLSQIRAKVQQAHDREPVRVPYGVNAWVLSVVLGCLCADWILRKRWGIA